MLFLALPLLSQAQVNLVPNAGFETYTSLPTIGGEVTKATGWSNLNGGTNWPFATPDYFHTSGSGDAALPNTFAGTCIPYEGTACAGFITRNGFVPGFREYMSMELSEPMQMGINYTISFWLTNGSANWYGGWGSDNIGVALTTNPLTQTQNEVVSAAPQAEITSITHHTNWVQYTFSVSAAQAYRYITIGNFRTDAATSVQTFTSGNGIAYYFIDLVSVSETSSLPANTVSLSQKDEAGIALEWTLPTTGEAGDWVLERSSDEKVFQGVSRYTNAGELFPGQTMDYTDEDAKPNVTYYYRLRHEGADGQVRFSNAITASFEGEASFTAGLVFPNPSVDHFAMEFASGEEMEVRMDLIDAMGKIVMTETRTVPAGENLLSYDMPNGIAAGIYHARFSAGSEQNTQRLVVTSSI